MTDHAPQRPSFHIVGANPSMDRTLFVRDLAMGEVNRAERAEPMAGGKGIIVARAMHRLGSTSAVYGFVGGVTGRYIRDECRRLRLTDRHTEVGGDTRINAIIVDSRTGDATVVNEPGPEITRAEAEDFFQTLMPRVARDDIVAVSGSLPRGLDAAFAARLVRDARERGARVVVDTSGRALQEAAAATPWAIKCNLEEFRSLEPDAPLVVRDDADRRRLVSQMHGVRRQGVDIVVVTLGAGGALAVSAAGAVWVRPPRIEVVNATGSGDTFLAGVLHALGHGQSLPGAVTLAVAASARNAQLPLPDLGPAPDLGSLMAGTASVMLDGRSAS
ncbi:1-phosphofructokinase family hexose kinase [Microbacterium sp. Re1]|uniref:1-phosphofructokinase family hexose kinase n=1 Tax=Microbacterium commune TaxID=2762219 RepID=A0ABR8W547_9MICO|nr:1-phosphofructokinase family hexose kinase [Microbacterium commune]MBD8012145.1 1-phosphofructokinase family hexose kinase [Microbacterium commune]